MMSFLDGIIKKSDSKQTKQSYYFGYIEDHTRDDFKAFVPKWVYRTPFGYPRLVNIALLRRLAKSPFAFMTINTIADEVADIEWEIQPKDEVANEGHIKEVSEFLKVPNENNENFSMLLRKVVRDILEVDSGVWVKVFDKGGKLSQLMAYDGATFTKNPDMHGRLNIRQELIKTTDGPTPEDAAYYQYGWYTPAAKPIPFGWREIVWFERNPRTDQHYGRSPIEVLADVIQSLVYGQTYHLEYFTNNSIPNGVIQFLGANTETLEAFKKQWQRNMIKTDALGDERRFFHQVPFVNDEVKFTQFQLNANELQLLESQKWYLKLVWSCFGVTPSEMGYTEDANRATDLSQSRVFKRKAIKPILELIEHKINREIIPEFGYEDIEFKFVMEDLEEELQVNSLYDMQLKNKLRTVNEIREKEGLDPVDWGEGPNEKPNPFGESPPGNEQPDLQKPKEEGEEKPTPANKPPGTKSVPSEKELSTVIAKYFTLKERQIIEEITRIHDFDKLNEIQIKNRFTDFVGNLKRTLTADALKHDIFTFIKNMFEKGTEKVEIEIDMNLPPNPAAIDFIKNHTFKNIKGMTDDLADKLRGEFERAMMNGEGVKEIKKRVKDTFKVSSNRANVIARTESARAYNHGQLETWKKSGISGKKEWIATMDNRTCPKCKALNGTTTDLNKQFKSGDMVPPLHPNCRCTLGFIPDD